MLCNVMLTYFYLNSYIVWLKSSYSLYWLIDSPFLANMFSLFFAEREKDLTIFCLFTALQTTPADFRSQIIWQQKCSGFWNLMVVDIFNDYNNHDNLSTHHLHCLLVPTDSCLKMKTEQPRCSLFGIPCMPTTVFFAHELDLFIRSISTRLIFRNFSHRDSLTTAYFWIYYLNFEDKLGWVQYLWGETFLWLVSTGCQTSRAWQSYSILFGIDFILTPIIVNY